MSYNMVQPANSVILHPIVSKPIPLDSLGKIFAKKYNIGYRFQVIDV